MWFLKNQHFYDKSLLGNKNWFLLILRYMINHSFPSFLIFFFKKFPDLSWFSWFFRFFMIFFWKNNPCNHRFSHGPKIGFRQSIKKNILRIYILSRYRICNNNDFHWFSDFFPDFLFSTMGSYVINGSSSFFCKKVISQHNLQFGISSTRQHSQWETRLIAVISGQRKLESFQKGH